MNRRKNVSSRWILRRSRAAVSVIASFLFFIPAVRATLAPYGADSSTLHLWHLDEAAVPCIDSAPGGTNLTSLANGATLGNVSALPAFTNCLSTLDGGQDSFGSTDSDAVLTTLGVNQSAVVTYCNPVTGAFTYEALVTLNLIPPKIWGRFPAAATDETRPCKS